MWKHFIHMLFGHGHGCHSLTDILFWWVISSSTASVALSLLSGFLINNIRTLRLFFFSPPPPMEPGLQQRCQDTELPLEVPAGELSQLQVQAVQPSVSQAEAQELKQVRPVRTCDLHFDSPYLHNYIYYGKQRRLFREMYFSKVPLRPHKSPQRSSCMIKMLFSETTNRSPSWF